MASFHKNAVITGLLDSYCLVCEIHLKEESEIRSHIDKLSHKEKLTSIGYDDKYKDDGIRKVKLGYYCEYCNSLYPTALLVHMHVSQQEHLKRKEVRLLRRQGDLVAHNGVAVDDDAWHGLSQGSCSLCDIDCHDKNDHKATPSHILRLVQSQVTLGPNGRIYRKKDDFFFCLICKELFALNTLGTHFDLQGHITRFDECCELFKQLSGQDGTVDANEMEANPHDKNDDKTQVKSTQHCESQVKIEEIKNETFQSEMALVTIAKTKIKELMKGTTETGSNQPSPPDSCHETSEIEHNKNARKRNNRAKKFAEVNKLALKEGTTSAFCSTCNVTISSSLKRMKEHVAEITHKTKAVDISKVLSNVKPTKEFVDRAVFIETAYMFGGLLIDVVVNEKFCLGLLSYSFMTRINSLIRCQLCEINLYNTDKESIINHVNSERHVEAHGKINVVCTLTREFIREVRPGLYHCGFCNIIEGSWSKLKDHLNSAAHKQCKAKCNSRLDDHMPDIRRRDERIAEACFRHMLFNMFN